MVYTYLIGFLTVLGVLNGLPLASINDDPRMNAWLQDQQQMQLQLMHQAMVQQEYRDYILTGHGRRPLRPTTEVRQIIQDLLFRLPRSTSISSPQFARIYDLLAPSTFREPQPNALQENTWLLIRVLDRVRQPTLGTSSFLQSWLSRLETATRGRRTKLLHEGIEMLRKICARLFILEGESGLGSASRWVGPSLKPTDIKSVLNSEIRSLHLNQALQIFSTYYSPLLTVPERDTVNLLSLTLTRLGTPSVSESGTSIVHVSNVEWRLIKGLMDAKKHALDLDGRQMSEVWGEIDARIWRLVGRTRPIALGSMEAVEENTAGRRRGISFGSLSRIGHAWTQRQESPAEVVNALEIFLGHHPYSI